MPLISYTLGWGEFPWGQAPWGEGIVPLAVTHGNQRRGEQWDECMRCGFVYPLSQLKIQGGHGGGKVVCVKTCLDEPSVIDLRPDELPREAPLQFLEPDC